MKDQNKILDIVLKVVSYILAATVGASLTLVLLVQFGYVSRDGGMTKLEQLQLLIEERFIGEADATAMGDAAAEGMIASLGDTWSYYISADQYQSFVEQMENAYVGVGITVTHREDGTGIDILQVTAGGPAEEAGLLPGDVIVAVNGEAIVSDNLQDLSSRVKGEEGITVDLTILRDGAEQVFTVERRRILIPVVKGDLLADGKGLVTIYNFDDRCASETIATIEELLSSGARTLIFDVRNNPGGYVDELVKLLDHLLPEGPLFRSVDYRGLEDVEKSDKNCVPVPMAVLMNGNSYSAAEFFAAALEEYNWAFTAGDPTTGKSYYQVTYRLDDGSAVNISIGEYTTPNGRSLADEGGLVPNLPVPVDDQTAANIYAGILEPADDPQIQAVVAALMENP